MLRFINKYKYLIITSFTLCLILIAIIWANYTPNTTLTGWDNHHVEYNPMLYIKRATTSVWQGWAGLGMVGGISYAADLPRSILVGITSIIIPTELVRYAVVFASLCLGVFGVFAHSYKNIFENRTIGKKSAYSFVAALFYLFNIATLQIFYTPVETFFWAYAMIPWMIFTLVNYLKTPSKLTLAALALTSTLGTAIALTPTTFIHYAVVVALFLIIHLFSTKDILKNIKTVLMAGLVLVITNLFWVLPSAYALYTKPDVVTDSKISTIVSEDIRDLAEKFSNIENVFEFKSFWFEQREFKALDRENIKNEPLLGIWVDYLAQDWNKTIGVIAFALLLIGVVSSLIDKAQRPKYLVVYLVGLTIGFSMLLGKSSPLSFLIYNNAYSETLVEIFRLPFTKFIYITIFFGAIFFAIGFEFIIKIFEKVDLLNPIKEILLPIMALTIFFLFFLKFLPIFQGKLFVDSVKNKVPEAYFELFDYFENESKEARILYLPVNTYLGWQYYEWGYQGSGFLWYGIEQPIIDRAFDVWSKQNEQAYLEINNAIYTKNSALLRSVLQKYGISHVILDKYVIDPRGEEASLYFEEAESLINSLDIEKNFESDKLSVYKLNDPKRTLLTSTIQLVQPKLNWEYVDYIYLTSGDYVNTVAETSKHFPYQGIEERNSFVSLSKINNKQYLNTKNLSKNLKTLKVPAFKVNNKFIFTAEFSNKTLTLCQLQPEILINSESLDTFNNCKRYTVNENKITLDGRKYSTKDLTKLRYFEVDNENLIVGFDKKIRTLTAIDYSEYSLENLNANTLSIEIPDISEGFLDNVSFQLCPGSNAEITDNNTKVKFETINGANCAYIEIPELLLNMDFIAYVDYKKFSGRSIQLDTINRTENIISSSNLLSRLVYIRNSGEKTGYISYFNSINRFEEEAINTIHLLDYALINAEFYNSIFLKNTTVNNIDASKKVNAEVNTKKIKDTLYEFEIKDLKEESYLIFNESYDSGWELFYFEKKPNILDFATLFLKGVTQEKHAIANNWANSWNINKGGYYVAWYVPQNFEAITVFILFVFLYTISARLLLSYYTQNGKGS